MTLDTGLMVFSMRDLEDELHGGDVCFALNYMESCPLQP